MSALRNARVVAAVVLFTVACQPGGSTRQATPWTPESSDLLFSSNRSGNSEIYLLHAGDTTWVNLTNDPEGDNWPEWSPDGQEILFQSRRSGNLDVWVMAADGSNVRRLTDDPAHDYVPSWSPDGTRIVFSSWRLETGEIEPAVHLYVMAADGSAQERLPIPSPQTSTPAVWSPDGARLVYSRVEDGAPADLYEWSFATGEERRLTSDPEYNGSPRYSPSGEWVAHYAGSDSAALIRVVSTRTGESYDVVGAGWNYYPRWSPDGEWLVYNALQSGDTATGDYDLLAIRSRDGDETVRLVSGPGREFEGSWRPLVNSASEDSR